MDRYMDRLEVATWAALKAVHVLSSCDAPVAAERFLVAVADCHWVGNEIDHLHAEAEVSSEIDTYTLARRFLAAYAADLPGLIADLEKDEEG